MQMKNLLRRQSYALIRINQQPATGELISEAGKRAAGRLVSLLAPPSAISPLVKLRVAGAVAVRVGAQWAQISGGVGH